MNLFLKELKEMKTKVKILCSEKEYEELKQLEDFYLPHSRYAVVAIGKSGKIIDHVFTYLKQSANQELKYYKKKHNLCDVKIIHIHNKRKIGI